MEYRTMYRLLKKLSTESLCRIKISQESVRVGSEGDNPLKRHIPVLPAAILLVLLFVLPVMSCLKPTEFDEDMLPPIPKIEPDPEPPPDLSADPINITGIAPVTGETAKDTLVLTAESLGSIGWIPAPSNGKFGALTDYIAVITLAMMGGRSLPPADISVTVEHALSSTYDAVSGKITAYFPRTHYPVKSVDDLAAAVSAVKNTLLLAADDKNIIDLESAFYTDANSKNTFITIGTDDSDNTIPYTVRGQGKYSAEALTAGILLANNNITLEDIRFNITTITQAIPHLWSSGTNPPATNSYYRAALSIGRYKGAPLINSDRSIVSNYAANLGGVLPSKNVVVRNCNISFTDDNSMLAGIYINRGADNIENISITDNTIHVESSQYAIQAILVQSYAPTLSITGNGLESRNVPLVAPSPNGSNPTRNPAGALFMQIHPDNVTGSDMPLIGDNIINGNPTYDFFINILSHGDRTGVQEMINNGFATSDSTWMTADSTDTGSFYKKLIDALLLQTRAGAGYGYLALYLGNPRGGLSDFVYEAYSRENAKLGAIDFWGYEISTPVKSYTNNQVRARILINPSTGRAYDTNGQFYWTRNIKGDNTNQGANIPNAQP
jgi:hypothetical protein